MKLTDCLLSLILAVIIGACATSRQQPMSVQPGDATSLDQPAVESSPSRPTPAGSAFEPRPLPLIESLPPEPLPPASDAASAVVDVSAVYLEIGEPKSSTDGIPLIDGASDPLAPLQLAPVEILPDVTESVQQSLANGLSKYAILFLFDDSPASKAAFAQASWLAKSRWPIVCVPITHTLAVEYGVTAAPQFVALYGGVEVGCADGTDRADIYRMVTTAYANQYAAAQPSGWTIDSLKAWLETYAENPRRKTTGVAGKSVLAHLTDASDPHRYPLELVKGLTPREQQLLHDADHDGLATPAGPRAAASTAPTTRKPPARRVQPYCPNCVRPQTYWRLQ